MPEISEFLSGVSIFFGISTLATTLISLYLTNKVKIANDKMNKIAEFGMHDYTLRREEVKNVISKIQEFECFLHKCEDEADRIRRKHAKYLDDLAITENAKLEKTYQVILSNLPDSEKKNATERIQRDSMKSKEKTLNDWKLHLNTIKASSEKIRGKQLILLDYFNYEIFKSVILLTKRDDGKKLVRYGTSLSALYDLWYLYIDSFYYEGLRIIDFNRKMDSASMAQKFELFEENSLFINRIYENTKRDIKVLRLDINLTREGFYKILSNMYQKY